MDEQALDTVIDISNFKLRDNFKLLVVAPPEQMSHIHLSFPSLCKERKWHAHFKSGTFILGLAFSFSRVVQ